MTWLLSDVCSVYVSTATVQSFWVWTMPTCLESWPSLQMCAQRMHWRTMNKSTWGCSPLPDMSRYRLQRYTSSYTVMSTRRGWTCLDVLFLVSHLSVDQLGPGKQL